MPIVIIEGSRFKQCFVGKQKGGQMKAKVGKMLRRSGYDDSDIL